MKQAIKADLSKNCDSAKNNSYSAFVHADEIKNMA